MPDEVLRIIKSGDIWKIQTSNFVAELPPGYDSQTSVIFVWGTIIVMHPEHSPYILNKETNAFEILTLDLPILDEAL